MEKRPPKDKKTRAKTGSEKFEEIFINLGSQIGSAMSKSPLKMRTLTPASVL
jgi:hypothetical protein